MTPAALLINGSAWLHSEEDSSGDEHKGHVDLST